MDSSSKKSPKMNSQKRSKLNYYFHKYCLIPTKIFRSAIVDTIRHDGIEHAGYLAFLSLLSFFPFLIFVFSIIGLFGTSETGTQVVEAILTSVPKEVAQGLFPYINEIISGPPQSLLTIAIIGVIWTASSSVEGLRTILNRAYRVAFPPPYVLRRLFSIIEFFVITFIIISGVVIFVILPSFLVGWEEKFLAKLQFDYHIFHLRHIIFLGILTCATSMLYYALPNAKQKISQTLPGSVLAVVLWVVLEYFFTLYLTKFDQVNFVYGSLAGIIISLMFFYFISLVFILGAEFNYHFHRTYQVFLKEHK